MSEHHNAAKAAGLLPIILQHPQGVVWRADGAAPALVDRLDARHADRGTAFGVDRMGVELPFLKADPHILDRLVAGLGDMERRHDAIVGPVPAYYPPAVYYPYYPSPASAYPPGPSYTPQATYTPQVGRSGGNIARQLN